MEASTYDNKPKQEKKKKLPANCKPVSLFSHTSKLMDRILLRRINKNEEQLGTIPDEQGGFREWRSTADQVMGKW